LILCEREPDDVCVSIQHDKLETCAVATRLYNLFLAYPKRHAQDSAVPTGLSALLASTQRWSAGLSCFAPVALECPAQDLAAKRPSSRPLATGN